MRINNLVFIEAVIDYVSMTYGGNMHFQFMIGGPPNAICGCEHLARFCKLFKVSKRDIKERVNLTLSCTVAMEGGFVMGATPQKLSSFKVEHGLHGENPFFNQDKWVWYFKNYIESPVHTIKHYDPFDL